ncbi:hypothetical protein GCM10027422_42020 [Hymenobacter arcticus]
MSTQKRFFDINQAIGFGKYSPMHIADIYAGSEDFPVTWYQQELQEVLLLFKPLGYPYKKFFEVSFDNARLKIKIERYL